MGRENVIEEEYQEDIITVKTVPTAAARIFSGDYTGYVFTLRGDPSNTGNIYIGKSKLGCTFPLAADDRQVTKSDLDKLFYYSDNGTEKLHIWGVRE